MKTKLNVLLQKKTKWKRVSALVMVLFLLVNNVAAPNFVQAASYNDRYPHNYTIEDLLTYFQYVTKENCTIGLHTVGPVAVGGTFNGNNVPWGDGSRTPSYAKIVENTSKPNPIAGFGGTCSDFYYGSSNTMSQEMLAGFTQNSDYMDLSNKFTLIENESKGLVTNNAPNIVERTVENSYPVITYKVIECDFDNGSNYTIDYTDFCEAAFIDIKISNVNTFKTKKCVINFVNFPEETESVFINTGEDAKTNFNSIYIDKAAIGVLVNNNASYFIFGMSGGAEQGQVNVEGMKLIYNFPDYVGKIDAKFLGGHMVAPKATVFPKGGRMEAGIIAKNVISETVGDNNVQAHYYPYNTPVPATPSTPSEIQCDDIELIKQYVDEQGNEVAAPATGKGALFTLYKNGVPVEDAINMEPQLVVDAYKVRVSGSLLETDTIYVLKETTPAEGFKINNTEYYCKIDQNGNVTYQVGYSGYFETVPTCENVKSATQEILKGTLKVTVKEKNSTTVIKDVSVTIKGPSGTKTVKTDANGTVMVPDLIIGNYTVEIPNKIGNYQILVANTQLAMVNENKPAEVLFELEKPAPTGTVIIKVKEENSSTLIKGAKVEITDKNGNKKTGTTGADGTVTFTEVPVGECDTKITEVPEGYYVTSKTEEKVTVPSGSSVTATYEVAKKGAIEINVLEKVSRDKVTTVEVTITGPNNYSHKETTGTDGQVSVSNLIPGTYTVTIPAENTGYEKLTGGSNTTTVVVRAGNTGKHTFELEEVEVPAETGTVIIKVKEENSSTVVKGAKVEIKDKNGNTKTGTTGADGTVTFTEVPVGECDTKITEVPEGYYVTSKTEEKVTVPSGSSVTATYEVAKKGAIEINVLEKVSRDKVTTVEVTITGPNNYSHKETTGTDGQVSVSNLIPGTYTVTIPAENTGYEKLTGGSNTTTVEVPAGNTVKHTFELVKVETPDEEKGNLTIKVTDEQTGKPVPGATVVITYPDGTKETKKTDENGEIKLPNAPTGSYTTEITDVPDGYNVTTDEEKTVTVNKDDDKTIEYKVDKVGSLKVIVKEKDSTTKVGNVKVTITGPNNYRQETTTSTSQDIEVKNLPIGNYTVTISKENAGYVTLTAAQAQKADVVKENATTEYVFELEKEPEATGNLTIKVTDEQTGEPVPGATVVITYPDGTKETKKTDENGEIKLPDVPTGSYTTEITDVPDGYNVTTDEEKTVTVNKDDDKTIEYVVDKVGALKVIVKEKDSTTKVGNVKVTITGPNNYRQETTTSTSQDIEVKNLPIGNYTVTISKENAGYVTLTAAQAQKADVVKENATTEYVFELEKEPEATGNLTIKVTDEQTGEPVPGATVVITYPDGTKETKKTDENGEIKLPNAPTGSYTTEITDVPDGYNVTTDEEKTVTVNKDDDTSIEYKVDKSDVQTGKGNLTITVTDEKTGAPVPGATVKVTDPSGKTTEYTTDANGQIKLTNVPAGTYITEITKVPDGYTVTTNTKATANVEVNKTAEAEYKVGKTSSSTDTPKDDPKNDTTDDPEDSDENEDEDEDDKLGNLTITVEDEVTGDPVPNATVKVTYPNGKSKTYKSNEDGEIELEDVPAGNYQIEVTDVPDGYTVTLNKKSTAKVKKGDTAEKIIKVKTSDANTNTNTNTNTNSGSSVKPSPNPSTPAKVTSSQPKTGDDMNPMFFLVLFLAATFALILSIFGLKRANRRERERQVTFRRQF